MAVHEYLYKNTAFELIISAGPVVKVILIILLLFSICCWAIIIYKWRVIVKARKQNMVFISAYNEANNLMSLYEKCSHLDQSPLFAIFSSGYTELSRILKTRGNPQPKESDPQSQRAQILAHNIGDIEHVNRALRRTMISEVMRLEKYLPFLATAASTAPFIGLFGTVWGIMDAFRSIGVLKTASLPVVAPGIAEALITTAAGLATAIPAVIFYNHYLHQVKILSSELEEFSSDFLNLIERGWIKKT